MHLEKKKYISIYSIKESYVHCINNTTNSFVVLLAWTGKEFGWLAKFYFFFTFFFFYIF